MNENVIVSLTLELWSLCNNGNGTQFTDMTDHVIQAYMHRPIKTGSKPFATFGHFYFFFKYASSSEST